ncbi:kin of IRRE-like protein 2 [Branchiostoma floridae x Branchiostoma belcheri]
MAVDGTGKLFVVVFMLWTIQPPPADGAFYRRRPESKVVLEGKDTSLSCSFNDLSSDDVVSWQGPPGDTIISSGRKVSVLYERHSIVGDALQGEYNLNIRDAQVEDSGDYRCSTPSVRAAADVTLTVIVPMVGPPDITGAELPLTAGDELLLRCRSRGGYPPPRLTWYNGTHQFGSEDTASNDEGGTVTLELFTARVSKWDDGANFTCVADQGFPDIVKTRAASRILRVDYPPTVSVPSPSIHAREGQSVNLTCYVDSNPKATVTWRKLGDRLPRDSIQRERSIQIVKVSKYDSGVYQCEADNRILPVGVGSIRLEVFYPPSIDSTLNDKVSVMYGNNDFSLNCFADGNPKPHIRWQRKDTSLYWENPLRFHRVRYDVEGTYQCVATSDGFPVVTKDVELDVLGKPQVEAASAQVSTNQGDVARFYCDVIGDPLPEKVTWLWRNKNGVESVLLDTNNGISIMEKIVGKMKTAMLSIDHVTGDDEGIYICKATNIFSSDQREIRLSVKESRTSIIAIISVSVAVIVMATVSVVGVFVAKKKGWICADEKRATPALSPTRSVPPIPKYGRKPGHGTNDSGVEDLEMQEMDGTLKPRPPPRVDKDWTSIGLSYPRLAHSNTLPPYSTVERHRPDGQDPRLSASIQEEESIPVVVQVEPPAPPPKDKKKRWKRRGGDGTGHSQQPGGNSGMRNHHQADNVLNEIQAESL